MSKIMSVFSSSVLISSLSCMILMVLNVDMAMAAMEMPMAINCFGRLGVEISALWGSALIMSRKSSSELSIIERLTSVTDFVMGLNGSSCWFSSLLYTSEMASLVLNTVVILRGTLT